MGYYLERSDGQPKGKADWLIANAGAVETSFGHMIGTGQEIPVVVVDNGAFEAAAVAFSPAELAVFMDLRDSRTKRFLLVPAAEILKQHPDLKLNWP